MTASNNILIFGGTGIIGQFITAAILESKADFGKVSLFTSSATVQNKSALLEPWKSRGLEIITGDVTSDKDVEEAYKSFDTVVSAVGRNVIGSQVDLVRIAEESGNIKRFFPSEYGTDIEYWPHSIDEKPHQQKLKVRAYIRDHVKRLEYTYLVTGPYSDLYIGKSALEPSPGTFDVMNKKAVLLGDGEGKISLTTMTDVGKLLVAALKNPEASKNRALKVNSFTTTPNEILAEYEKQTGSKWAISYLPLEELKKIESGKWAEGNPSATPYTLRRIWLEGGTLYEKRDNERIGAPESETMAENVAVVIQKQTKI